MHAHMYERKAMAHPVSGSTHTLDVEVTTTCTIVSYAKICTHTVEPLYKGHLSNEDTVYSPNHIELCTNPPNDIELCTNPPNDIELCTNPPLN